MRFLFLAFCEEQKRETNEKGTGNGELDWKWGKTHVLIKNTCVSLMGDNSYISINNKCVSLSDAACLDPCRRLFMCF